MTARPTSPEKAPRRHGGRLVHARRDDYGLIEVVDHPDRRCLHFGSPVQQSCLRRDGPPRPAFDHDRKLLLGAALHPDPRHILVLGLGGGTVAGHLHRHLPAARLTAVERREAVIDVALAWFDLPADERLQLYSADALLFLRELPGEYDLQLVDLFDAEGLDGAAQRLGFFDHCRDQLRPGGLLVMNLWRDERDAYLATCDALETGFGGRVWYLDEQEGNTVAYAFRDAAPTLDAAVRRRAAALGLDGAGLLRQLRRRNAARLRG